MIDFPCIDHWLEPSAFFSGTLHRQKKRQKLVSVGRPGIFAQGLTEGLMLGLAMRRELRRVGGHKGERRFRIATVFRQIEMHASDQIPSRVQPFQEALQIRLCRRQGNGNCSSDLCPQRPQNVSGQVFGPRHHRPSQHQRGKFSVGWRRNIRHDRRRRGTSDRGG